MSIETDYKELFSRSTELLYKVNINSIVEEIKLSSFPNEIIEIVKPPQELMKIQSMLMNDISKLYKMCLFLGEQENKEDYYNIFFDMSLSLTYFGSVEIYLVNLIAFNFRKESYVYFKHRKEYDKIYNKWLRETKKVYREYKKYFSKMEKEYNKIYSSKEQEYNKNKLMTVNMNTVYSGIVENKYKSMCVNNPDMITELTEEIKTGVRPEEIEQEIKEEIMKGV